MSFNISNRIKYISTFIDESMLIGDIGSDHGYLPLYLFENNKITYAYACDNKKGPYLNLLSTFDKTNYNMEFAVNDGLNNLPKKVNTLIITGIGGELIISILSNGKTHLEHIDKMILSPQHNIPKLRKYLSQIGYMISDEGVIKDDKFYFVIKVEKGTCEYSDFECKYGPILLKKMDNVFLEYLIEEREYYLSILNKPNLRNEKKHSLINEINELTSLIGDNYEF